MANSNYFLMRGCTLAVMSMLAMRATGAPLTLDGATFDAPASCQLTGGALVCKEDGQQLELWVYRTPLKAASMETLANKMSRVAETHQAALKNISANADSAATSSFSSYGNYAVNGSRIAGKGVVSAPSVALATLLNGDDIFQIIEVVAQRTPRIEALTAALQRSLKLPGGTANVIGEGSDAAVAAVPPGSVSVTMKSFELTSPWFSTVIV